MQEVDKVLHIWAAWSVSLIYITDLKSLFTSIAGICLLIVCMRVVFKYWEFRFTAIGVILGILTYIGLNYDFL